MGKHYTIEVPVNSHPSSHLAKLNQIDGIGIKLIGGIPDSPFNGGRNNFILDRENLFGRLLFGVNKKQLLTAVQRFYENIDKANSNGIPFYLVLTNMFVAQKELNEENLRPIDRLVEYSRKYNVKNGLILNNSLLEDHIRQKYGADLIYVSSCTKYVVPDRILTPRETLKMYLEDIKKYDFVVLTPQDSRREKLIREVVRENPEKIITITNSYCLNTCNCYDHYEYLSHENKESLLHVKSADILIRAARFAIPRIKTCSAYTEMFRRSDYKALAEMQLRSGVIHFKLGRGLGEDFLDSLVSIILKFKKFPT